MVGGLARVDWVREGAFPQPIPEREEESIVNPENPMHDVIGFRENEVGLVPAYLRGLPSPATRKVYSQVVRDFETFLADDLLSATRRQIEAYTAHLKARGLSPSTVAKHLSALAGLYDFAVSDGMVDRNPVAVARRPKVPDSSPRRALSPSEVRALLAAPDVGTLIGLRDHALLVTLAVQGWRIFEALNLQVADLDEEQGQRTARIVGKGSKIARVPLASATWNAIRAWLDAAGILAGPVFAQVLKGGRVQAGEAISMQSAWKRLRRLAVVAGIRRPIHAHLFRHTAITQALAAGIALHEVQDFARHSDPRTTRRYDSHRDSLANRSPHVLAALLVDQS